MFTVEDSFSTVSKPISSKEITHSAASFEIHKIYTFVVPLQIVAQGLSFLQCIVLFFAQLALPAIE